MQKKRWIGLAALLMCGLLLTATAQAITVSTPTPTLTPHVTQLHTETPSGRVFMTTTPGILVTRTPAVATTSRTDDGNTSLLFAVSIALGLAIIGVAQATRGRDK